MINRPPFERDPSSSPAAEQRSWSIFRLQRRILLVFGIWPADRESRGRLRTALIALNLAVLAICMVGEFLHGLYAYQDGDLGEAIESICPTVARVSGLLRMVFYLMNERKIERVLKTVQQVLRDEHPRERANTRRITYLGQRLTLHLFLMMFFAAMLYGLTPFLGMAYNWHQGQRPLVKILPFKLALPYDWQNGAYFALTTLFLNYASVPTITSQSGSDALLTGVCLYFCGQFNALRLEIESLGPGPAPLVADEAETRHINRELRRISRRHQRTIEMVHEVRAAFAPNILLVYTCTALIMCIVCIAMLIVEGIYKFTYLPYAFAELAILFLYSYSGTIIRDASEAIQTVAYNFPWYRYNRDTRHLIQMMMIRAQRGSNLNVPFFETSMATFSVIVRSASSYITLMKSFL
ncbi:odorant receptor 22c-like [Anopheles cruzii]|uniref:odorant receptor 22c-like n=1 Tax=Anopheles cruzii TaxID=68878 RepID=UPI0022EC28C9|nr:odorant receptor 22c-like [Anopheles cruzii]